MLCHHTLSLSPSVKDLYSRSFKDSETSLPKGKTEIRSTQCLSTSFRFMVSLGGYYVMRLNIVGNHRETD